ncbi:hypothetical protein CF035_13055 [Klebsiella pneumoniae]|nr:hypothetical protein [Klebsiella pneumoniae]
MMYSCICAVYACLLCLYRCCICRCQAYGYAVPILFSHFSTADPKKGRFGAAIRNEDFMRMTGLKKSPEFPAVYREDGVIYAKFCTLLGSN